MENSWLVRGRDVCDRPALSDRLRRVERHQSRNALAVFCLLGVDVVLMTIGLARLSFVAWSTGAAAVVMSFLVDGRTKGGPASCRSSTLGRT